MYSSYANYLFFCYAKDLTDIATKFKTKTIHVPKTQDDSRPGTTVFLYFENDEDLEASAAKEEKLYYQGRQLHLVLISEKALLHMWESRT